MTQPTVRRADYSSATDRSALVELLDAYATDPMGGGAPLPSAVRATLCDALARQPGAASFIAWQDGQAIGLINCFEGFSTFKAQPLLNVHDLVVLPAHRGQGVGQALLSAAQNHARQRGCCKLTLEVLTGNTRAWRSYQRFGFAPYTLDPRQGQAQMMQKWL